MGLFGINNGQNVRRGTLQAGNALTRGAEYLGKRQDEITTRDVLSNTKNNDGDLLNRNSTQQIDDEYTRTNDVYDARMKQITDEYGFGRETIEAEAAKAGSGEQKQDIKGNYVPTQKAIDAGNTREGLISKLNAEYAPVLADLNQRTQDRYSAMQNAPIADAQDYSQRVYRDLISKGISVEDAEKTRKSVLEANKEKDLTGREKISIGLQKDSIDAAEAAGVKAANTSTGSTTDYQGLSPKGDGSGGFTPTGKASNSVRGFSTGGGAPVGPAVGNIQKSISTNPFFFGDGKKDVPKIFKEAVTDGYTVPGIKGKIYADPDVVSSIIEAGASGEDGAIFNFDSSYDGDNARAAIKKATVENYRDYLKNGGSKNNKVRRSITSKNFDPNRGKVTEDVLSAAAESRRDLADSLKSPNQRTLDNLQSKSGIDELYKGRNRLKPTNQTDEEIEKQDAEQDRLFEESKAKIKANNDKIDSENKAKKATKANAKKVEKDKKRLSVIDKEIEKELDEILEEDETKTTGSKSKRLQRGEKLVNFLNQFKGGKGLGGPLDAIRNKGDAANKININLADLAGSKGKKVNSTNNTSRKNKIGDKNERVELESRDDIKSKIRDVLNNGDITRS